ncbi:glutamate receptor ionotropic, NMDA 3A-like [Vanessa atalanta]|uniref:glutamate receptor ionotropic, NMDA 3A-like n=1 Tax=Vanessa atalanta TaxID=42275 RepID=UPI001FCCD797|nr:glutamate receptor ionotropic, NMDA 3A-like [Vanessa atalanta]
MVYFEHTTTIIILLNISYICANLEVENDENIKHNDVIKSAVEIANKNFEYRISTVIISHDVEESILNQFIKFYRGTVTLERNDKVPTKQVVILIESYLSLIRILGKLKPDLKGKTMLHSDAYYIIVVLSYPHRLRRIYSLLWGYYATNVVTVVTNKDKRIALFTYYPYKNHLNCQNLEPTLIGFWGDGEVMEKDLFPDKMINMNGCPLYISTNKLYHPATEQKIPLEIIKRAIIRYLRDIMNFTPILSSRDFLSIDSDGAKNWSETLDDILTGSANISTCSIAPGMDRVGILDYSVPYFRISLAWLAPPLAPGPIWWRLFSPLNGYLWLILLLVILFVKSIPFTLNFKRIKMFCFKNFKHADKLHGVVIRIWAVLMGQPIRVEPKRFRDFYILSLWIWFTFVVRSAYQSVLIGALKSDVIVGNFIDLKDACNNGYKFGGRAGVLAHFEHDTFIRENFEVVPEREFENVFQEVLGGKKKFIIALSLEYVKAYCMSQGINENECGYILPDSIMKIPLVIWMGKNSAFMRPLSLWLIRLLESGLLEKDTVKMSSKTTMKVLEPSALNNKQVFSCILCLLLGYLVSGIVFIFEIIKFKSDKTGILKESKKIMI